MNPSPAPHLRLFILHPWCKTSKLYHSTARDAYYSVDEVLKE